MPDTRQRIGAFWRLANQGMRRLLESGYFWLILVATTFSGLCCPHHMFLELVAPCVTYNGVE